MLQILVFWLLNDPATLLCKMCQPCKVFTKSSHIYAYVCVCMHVCVCACVRVCMCVNKLGLQCKASSVIRIAYLHGYHYQSEGMCRVSGYSAWEMLSSCEIELIAAMCDR